jgi:hypothetical protein
MLNQPTRNSAYHFVSRGSVGAICRTQNNRGSIFSPPGRENDLFNIKIWNEINVAPLRAYIEEWVKRQLKQAANERQQTVANIPVAVENILETAVIVDINERATARK